jgi:hypothetical protein
MNIGDFMNTEMKVGSKLTIPLKTVVDGKGISFTPQGDVIIVQGVLYDEEKVFAEIIEVHEKTIIANKITGAGAPAPPPNAGNGYEVDDVRENDYDDDEEAPNDEDEV